MTENRSAAPIAARKPSIGLSLIPVVTLVLLLAVNVKIFDSASNQIALILATAVAAACAIFRLKRTWSDIEDGMFKAIGMAMQAMMILMIVGMLIAAWIKSGVVPLLVVYGLDLITPEYFLVTACAVCCIVSSATGSSWTTAGTVGVALIGVGKTLGLDAGMVAGAIVSGSYFGDKMSPLSDTTNLAPAMAGATLIEHVKHMFWTVTPAITIAMIAYWFLGGHHAAAGDSMAGVEGVVKLLESNYTLSPWLLIPPVLVIALIACRVPALPALIIGTFGAVIVGLITQPLPVMGEAKGGFIEGMRSKPVMEAFRQYFDVLWSGISSKLADTIPVGAEHDATRAAATTIDGLFDGKGGMSNMMGTVALIFCALSFGGVMERSGMLGAIADAVLSFVKGTGSLVAATIFTCFGVNILASDQYMAIVVPGRMFRTAFLDRRLHPKNLSRCLEDSGTVTSALIPWNTCGAQMAIVLGVATTAYAPYALLNWICPLVSILYGFTGLTITKISDEEAKRYSVAN